MQTSCDVGGGFPRPESLHRVVEDSRGCATVSWDRETIAGGRMDGHEEFQTTG